VGAEVACGGLPVLMVACGDCHSLVVTKDGALWTFGRGQNGALGHNDRNNRLVPTRIEAQHFGNAKIVSIAGGESHSAAVTEEGTLYTWGKASGLGHANQLGGKVGAHAHRRKPTAGRTRWALPRSAADARPRLCHGHAFSARLGSCGLAAALRLGSCGLARQLRLQVYYSTSHGTYE